ncbi:MAG: class I SAM-dependent methyltransferase [Thermofilaceae archaeon]
MHAWKSHANALQNRGAPSPRLGLLVDALGGWGRVLEVGCGSGRNTIPLAMQGVEVVALDVAIEPLLFLGACCERVRATGEFHLPFPDSSFDGILDSYAFTFISNRKLYARELHRVLKPKGLLLLEFDEEPHVKSHKALERALHAAFGGLFEPLEVHRIHHAWGIMHEEGVREVPAIAALLRSCKD